MSTQTGMSCAELAAWEELARAARRLRTAQQKYVSKKGSFVEISANPRGYTVRDVARYFRVGRARILTWIRSGELKALNTAAAVCGRPRFVVTPEALSDFERRRQAITPTKSAPRRTKRTLKVDFFPD
jgi:hypothetical protein